MGSQASEGRDELGLGSKETQSNGISSGGISSGCADLNPKSQKSGRRNGGISLSSGTKWVEIPPNLTGNDRPLHNMPRAWKK